MKNSGADFRPFRAWRYNPEKVSIQDVIAPPYDVISEEEQSALYKKSNHNCIRLILNKEEPADDEKSNRYTRARDFYESWKKDQILIQESKPALYLYKQIFKHPVDGVPLERTALLGRLKLEAFDRNIVIPHEKTLSKPKADRRKLLETTHANLSPIFGLYEHPHDQLQALQHGVLSKKALYEALDEKGVRHFLWPVQDEKIVTGIHKSLAAQKIYIADGHHRYQISLEYAQERRRQMGAGLDHELDSDFIYMALVEFNDPGLVLMPTHRMLLPFAGFDPSKMASALEPFFQVEKMGLHQIEAALRKSSEELQMGLLTPGQHYLITLKQFAEAKKRMPQDKPEAWCRLDVALVSHLILGRLWQLPESEWENTIRYTHSDEEAVNFIRGKNAAAVFLLRAPKVEILRDMGRLRELLPQKSTYFYPKLASGLLFNQHER